MSKDPYYELVSGPSSKLISKDLRTILMERSAKKIENSIMSSQYSS